MSHHLDLNGPLHVPLTSTFRHHFGTNEVQVNPLASRMIDSSLDNVGTYGVRFDVDLKLKGQGLYDLVLSHPAPNGGKPFIAFRGSIQVQTREGTREYHVVLRAGQSLPITSLNLEPGVDNPIKVVMVYPADATPGHLLSVVPASQLARIQEQDRQLELARAEAERQARAKASQRAKGKGKPAKATPQQSPPPLPDVEPVETLADLQLQQPEPLVGPPPSAPAVMPPAVFPPAVGPAVMPPASQNPSMVDRYQQALEAQQSIMRGLMGN